jgi:hypothetical protein
LEKLGFIKGVRDGVYLKSLGDNELVYIMCRPRLRSPYVVLDPIIAFENITLRKLIGPSEPEQREPRIAHKFLSYWADSGSFWRFDDEEGMLRALDEIENVLLHAALPFATACAPLQAAAELLRAGLKGEAPVGVVIHPTRNTSTVLEGIPGPGERMH